MRGGLKNRRALYLRKYKFYINGGFSNRRTLLTQVLSDPL